MTTSSIIQSISSPRLSSYKEIFDCTDDTSCFPYYLWNQRLSSELYILFSTIEICLRNRIHTVLSEEVSLKFIHKTVSNFAWYDYFSFCEVDKNGNPKLNKEGRQVFTETGKAFRKITHKKNINLKRLPQIIISQLSFGKWVYVLSAKKYKNDDIIDWNSLFPLLFANFKGMDDSKHKSIIERIGAVTSWRNRLAHLEPLWKFKDIKDSVTGKVKVVAPRNQEEVIKRLNAEIRRTLALLSWLCSDTYIHYTESESYQKLKFWASNEGLTTFL